MQPIGLDSSASPEYKNCRNTKETFDYIVIIIIIARRTRRRSTEPSY
jgi:hypothetical protein